MAQYTEGQFLHGSDGRMYVVRNGVPVTAGPQALVQNPKLPGEMAQQQATLTRTQQEVKQAEATAAANTAKANAEAQSAQIAAKVAQEQWNINHPGANGSESLSGPAYMQSLQKTDPGRAAYIQGLAEGRVPFPGGQMMRSPAGQALLTQVMRADPTIDATNYTTRAAARKNAASGNLSQSDNALTTAVGHAARLATLVPSVFGSPVQPFNSVANSVQGHLMGGPQPAYDQNAALLGDELAKVYGGGAQGDRQSAGDQFSSTLSTDQKNNNIHGAIDLMLSKLAANRAQFAYGNGQLGKPDFMLLPQNVRDELKQAGASDLAQKYFSGVPVMGANGAVLPPGAPPAPPSGGLNVPPAPGGPTNAMPSGSTNGFSDMPNPQASAFWDTAAHQGMPYSAALSAYEQQAKARGDSVTMPPDPAKYGQAVNYMQANPSVDYHPFQGVTRTQMSPTGNAVNNAVQSPAGTFAGHYLDSLGANIPSALMGDQGSYYNAITSQQNPKSAMLGNVLGTVGGAMLGTKAVDGIAPFLGKYGQVIGGNAARSALTGDTAYGAVSGAAQNPDHPVLGGIGGMGAMAAGNAAGRYVLGPALARAGDTAGGQYLANTFGKTKGMFGGTPATFNPPPPLDQGQSLLMKNAGAPDAMSGIQQNLQDASGLGLPYTLADSNPQLRSTFGSAVRKSPNVQQAAEALLQPRQMGQGERAIGQINSNLAPVGDVPTMVANAKAQAQAASAPLYQKAMQAPAPNDPQLNDMLNSPAGGQAVRSAYNIALNNGENPAELSFGTDPQGQPTIKGNPNWKTLQYTKMGLDSVVEGSRDPITGQLNLADPATRAVNDLRGRFVGRMGDLNPDYAAANQAYQGAIGQGTAAQQGANATGIGVTPEQAQIAATNSGPNFPSFQQGYASNMADQIERQRLTGNPYNLVNGSMGQQAKLSTIFPQGAPNFSRAQALEGDMGKTYTEALGGSQTAGRTQADKMFDNADLGMDLAQSAFSGVPPLSMGMTLLRKAADARNMGFGQAKADAIGPLLMNPDPSANLATLDQIQKAMLLRRGYMQNAGAMGGQLGAGMFGAPATYALSQQ